MARVELGERIASLREEQALTQADLAEKARISPSTLSQIESGRVPRPHVGTVRKIARALGVEPQDLRRTEELALSGKADAGAEPSVYRLTNEERVKPEQLRERGIQINDSEAQVLNQLLQMHEHPPTGATATWHLKKENEPVDHERVALLVAYVLASGMLTQEETEAVREALHDELAGARG
jgi:transcriptional regulator with XRE-family HTH domain